MPELRILIADDHAAVRRSVRALVESHAQWTVCGEAADGEEAVERAAELRPDVAVLDREMPRLSGIEAARRIRARVPTVQILLLTMHDSNQLHEEARQAGAREVVVKSDAGTALLVAIESLHARDMAIALAGSTVGEQRHIGAFFPSARERDRILGPFVAEGIVRGDKALHIIDPPDRGVLVRRLAEYGVDAEAAEARHQLDLLSWSDTYLRHDRFDQFEMTALMHDLTSGAKAEGYPLTRVVAHMEWAVRDQPGVSDLVEYEARLNDELAHSPDVVICAYDLTKFPGHLILDVLRGHARVIVAGVLRDNPFYTPSAVMVEELRTRGEA